MSAGEAFVTKLLKSGFKKKVKTHDQVEVVDVFYVKGETRIEVLHQYEAVVFHVPIKKGERTGQSAIRLFPLNHLRVSNLCIWFAPQRIQPIMRQAFLSKIEKGTPLKHHTIKGYPIFEKLTVVGGKPRLIGRLNGQRINFIPFNVAALLSDKHGKLQGFNRLQYHSGN